MIGVFRRTGPMAVPLLLLLAVVLKLSFFSHPVVPEAPSAGGILDNFLYKSVNKILHPAVAVFIAFIFLVLSALFANYVLLSRRMYLQQGMLPALAILIFSSLFPGSFFLHAGIVLLPVTIWLYASMMKLYNTGTDRTTIINMGLLAGTATLLYHPYWWMLPVCFYALSQMRPFKFREWFLLLFSFLTPAYFLLAYEFITDQWNPSRHWPVWNPIDTLAAPDKWDLVALATAAVWILAGFLYWQKANRRMLIQVRKNWYILLIMGVLMLPSMVFPRNNVSESLIQLAFPVGAIAAHAFMGEKNVTRYNLLLAALIIISVVLSLARIQSLGM